MTQLGFKQTQEFRKEAADTEVIPRSHLEDGGNKVVWINEASLYKLSFEGALMTFPFVYPDNRTPSTHIHTYIKRAFTCGSGEIAQLVKALGC